MSRRRRRRGTAPPRQAPSLVSHAAGASEGRIDIAVAVGLTVASALLYFLTAARDIVVGDTPELAAVALTLGVAHPPGYPLLTILGHAFSWLPFGPPPFRVNLLVVVCSAVTVGLTYLTARRLVGERVWAALAAVLLAVNPLFWEWSLATETFPLNNLLAAGMIYLLVEWHEQPNRTALLVGSVLLGGLGLTNHQSIVLLAPAALYVLWTRRSYLVLKRSTLPACAAALLISLLPYAYVPWAAAREPFWNWMGVSSLDDLVALFTRQNYGTGQLVNVPGIAGGSAVARIGAHIASFNTLELSLLALGAIGAYLWQKWYFWFSVLALAAAGPAFAAYANIDLSANYIPWVFERFFLLSHVVAAPVMAFGLLFVAYVIREVGSAASRTVSHSTVRVVVALPVVVAIGAGVALNYRPLDQSASQVARVFAEDVLASVEPGAVLIASGDENIGPLAYLQVVEGHRLDVQLVMGPLLTNPWYVRQIRVRHPDLGLPFERMRIDAGRMRNLVDANQGRVLYTVGTLLDVESLADAYTLSTRGLVFRIERAGEEPPLEQLVAENERLIQRYAPPR